MPTAEEVRAEIERLRKEKRRAELQAKIDAAQAQRETRVQNLEQVAGTGQGGGRSAVGARRALPGAIADAEAGYRFTDDMSKWQQLQAGFGKAASNLGTGIQQLMLSMPPTGEEFAYAAETGGNAFENRQAQRDQLAAEVDQMRQRDQPLMETGMGELGNFTGNVALSAPLAAIPGGQSLPAAAAYGALGGGIMGAVSPRGEGESLGENVMGGSLMGMGGGAAMQRVARTMNPQINPVSRELLDADVPLTFGQTLGPTANKIEQAATSIPILETFIRKRRGEALEGWNNMMLNRVLEPLKRIGRTTEEVPRPTTGGLPATVAPDQPMGPVAPNQPMGPVPPQGPALPGPQAPALPSYGGLPSVRQQAGVPGRPGVFRNDGPIEGEFTVGRERMETRGPIRESVRTPVYRAPEKIEGSGYQALTRLGDEIDSAYNNTLARVERVDLDVPFFDAFNRIDDMVRTLPRDQRQQYREIIRQNVGSRITPAQTTSGEKIKTAISELGRRGTDMRASADANMRQLGDALIAVREELSSLVARQYPEVARDLSAADEAYAMYLRLEGASAMQGAENGIFTPKQLLNSSRRFDRSIRKRAFGHGEALMQREAEQASNIIDSTVRDSGTTERALANTAILGGLSFWRPEVGATVGGLSVAYTRPIQAALRGLIAGRRPEAVQAVGRGLESITPVAGGATAAEYLGE